MVNFRNLGIRIVCTALVLLTALAVSAPALASQDEETVTYAYTSTVYYSASDDSMSIGFMEDGAKLTVLDDYGSHYKIDCYDMNGYIAKSQVEEVDGEYYVNCDPDSSQSRQVPYISVADAFSVRTAIVDTAEQQLGVPYVMGGTSPQGFDCSGFVQYVLKNNNFDIRRTVTQQLQDTIIISRESLLPGDLVFFRIADGFASHIGIYVGDGQIIHAGNAGIRYADLDSAYFTRYYLCCRRILNVDTSASQQLPSAAEDGVSMARSLGGLRTAP